MRAASFNVFGIGGKDVSAAVGFATGLVGPDATGLGVVAFQEVWTEAQRDTVLAAYCGTAPQSVERANVTIHRSGDGAWRCLVPKVPAVVSMPLSSGLALCVRGPVKDSFFVEYRGGAVPDSLAHKGVLAALVEAPGEPRRAFVNTHLHDYSNDRFGKYRWAWLDTLVSCVQWINAHWRVKTVLLGDFNIDSVKAYSGSTGADYRLYARLIRMGMGGDARWYDVNVRVNQGKPVKTTSSRAIDHHLVAGETPASATFEAHQTPASDHFLTVSAW